MTDFQNVSIQSLYAVLLCCINYVDMQSYQTMHQLYIRCLIAFSLCFVIVYTVNVLYSSFMKHYTLFKHKAINILLVSLWFINIFKALCMLPLPLYWKSFSIIALWTIKVLDFKLLSIEIWVQSLIKGPLNYIFCFGKCLKKTTEY